MKHHYKKAIFTLFFMLFSLNLNARTVSFAGCEWTVKTGDNIGPGPNDWSDDTGNVWIDGIGRLHLKIRKEGNNWYCSEIYTILPTNY